MSQVTTQLGDDESCDLVNVATTGVKTYSFSVRPVAPCFVRLTGHISQHFRVFAPFVFPQFGGHEGDDIFGRYEFSFHRSVSRKRAHNEPVSQYVTAMSHVTTQLGDDEFLVTYTGKCRQAFTTLPMPLAHILIVNDDTAVSMITEGILVNHGYRVTKVKDGGAALDFLKSVTPDLMLLDIQLPDMDGIQVRP